MTEFEKLKKKYQVYVLFFVVQLFVMSANASECGSLENAYGPFDYLEAYKIPEKLELVEVHHFTPKVERLIDGQEGRLWEDLDYTLRVFPNHHRALLAMSRYQLKTPTEHLFNSKLRSTECYFNRANRMSPKDAIVYMIWGIYLHKQGTDLSAAQEKYDKALSLGYESSEIFYNYGLLLFDAKKFVKSKQMAKKAYDLGFPLMGLKDKLKKEKAW